MKKRLNFILGRKKKEVIEYPPMSKFVIPSTVSMPAYSFYGKIEQHVRYHKTFVPSGKKITWGLLTKHNPCLLEIQNKIIIHEGRNFPDKAWDNVAFGLVVLIKTEFLSIKKEEKEVELQLERELETA